MNKYFIFGITPKYPFSSYLKFYQNVRMKNSNLKNCQLQHQALLLHVPLNTHML